MANMGTKRKGKTRRERHHRGHSGACSYCEGHRLNPKRSGPCMRHDQKHVEEPK